MPAADLQRRITAQIENDKADYHYREERIQFCGGTFDRGLPFLDGQPRRSFAASEHRLLPDDRLQPAAAVVAALSA